MTASSKSVAVLLVELAQCGITLRAAGDRLRFHPRSAMTPPLADRVKEHRAELLSALAEAASGARYTPKEQGLLSGCPSDVWDAVGEVKDAFAPLGGMEVVDVRPFKGWHRYDAAQLIRQARQRGERSLGVALRDAWRERLAICIIEGGMPAREAAAAAVAELEAMLAAKQVWRYGAQHG